MRGLLTLLFSLLISLSFAQTFRVVGRCVDRSGDPVDLVKIYSKTAKQNTVYSDDNGEFELIFEAEGVVDIFLRSNKFEEKINVEVKGKKTRAPLVKFPFQQVSGVDVSAVKQGPDDIPPLPTIPFEQIPSPNGFSKYLVLTTSAVSNNELTTNYNVRGGSYDENLVYVNGFNVYRPFLTRSGQQEGMGFVHSALVESLKFSGGGFSARYGDKMSSVLDINYRTPTSFHGSLNASLLGVEMHVEQEVNSRFNYLIGGRFRSNGYLLNALPTTGAYNPVFWDAQFLTNFAITENLTWSVLGHFSSNNYRFRPETQETDFGTANEAYTFKVYFEGQEQTQFNTMMGGTSLKWKNRRETTHLDFYATVFNTVEEENFDILGEYYINELETDPSKEEFGDSVAVLGVGGFLNHARNKLNATIINLYHHGDNIFKIGYKDQDSLKFRMHQIKWGVNFQMDDFNDKLSEWKLVDSAGYSIPQSGGDDIVLFETVKGKFDLKSQRYTGFFQFNSNWSNSQRNKIVSKTKSYKYVDDAGVKQKGQRNYLDTIVSSQARLTLSIGSRAGYTTSNSEFFVTPRAVLRYYPRSYMVRNGKIARRNVNFHLASGLYYQPPFYREFRTFDGQLNLDVKAQKSAHVVLGTDVYFDMWNREVPFKFTAEAYYKYLWDINSYEIDNVRTRYYANNDAKAYAYGIDLNVHGQFVEGIESFFKIGFLRTEEDVLNDYYYDYYNAGGDKIVFGISDDQVVVDSVLVEPGYVPRPTDQWINFGALIQDRMPKYESISVQMGLQFGSRLPYGPPDFNRYKDTLRQKSYFRVDLGMSYDFLYKNKKNKKGWFRRNFTTAMLSFEVFNLLGVNNVLSKQWIQDTQGRYYSIPNYLTQRRFNLKMILRF